MSLEEGIRIEVFKESVRLCESEDPQLEEVYRECLEKMKKVNLKDISENGVHEIVRRFLYDWGKMNRVLEQRKGWEKKLANLIWQESDCLEGFRRRFLEQEDLAKFKDDVDRLYEGFKGVLGKVAAAKVMHLICPDFFPPWDNDIERVVKRFAKFKGESYYRFMQVMQDFLKQYDGVLSEMAGQRGKSKLKILDEFLWFITRDQLKLFFKPP